MELDKDRIQCQHQFKGESPFYEHKVFLSEGSRES